ncbi:hypothetical protein AJ80_07751 [Polytolypa hystricis UAMH7299]|uniref:C2H2-type domain-containing protein n=1 Tax=Polytolypa hystricis (strain UAMH7299) TaxID=1447883 RepID=A0A2B7XIZ5_POLH7|nr:hypothetical protein AJ80_07751 [Polytolypa hystricis UAMH7299]
MTGLTFTLPQIRLSEDSASALNGEYPLAAHSTNLKAMPDHMDYSFTMDHSEIPQAMEPARPTYMELRLSGLRKSIECQPLIDPQIHGAVYYVGGPSPTKEAEAHPFPGRDMRYISPNGSCGGDRSATELDSAVSEQSWEQQHHYSQPEYTNDTSAFPSPASDIFRCYPDHLGPPFPQNVDNSCCGSEYSVSLREVQHYPDLEPKVDEAADDQAAIYPIPQFLSFNLLSEPTSHITQDEQMFDSEPVPEWQRPTEYPVEEEDCNDENSQTSNPDYPRKRMRYSASTCTTSTTSGSSGSDSPTSSKDNNNTNKNKTTSSHSRKNSSSTSPVSQRVGKRGCRRVPARFSRKSKSTSARQGKNSCIFVCTFAPYGCDATFGAKNEWKRHVACQHLQLGFYRCDVGHCNVSGPPQQQQNHRETSSPSSSVSSFMPSTSRTPNDFNRKDLFTQHQRRMHAPWPTSTSTTTTPPPSKQQQSDFETSLEAVRQRCWNQRRSAPQRSVCNFCRREFSGAECWDTRMEHVGKHYQTGDVAEVAEDVALKEWAIEEGIITTAAGDGRWILANLKDE